MARAEQISPDQLHHITRSAKLAGAIIAYCLVDLDDSKALSENAREWLDPKDDDGPLSITTCTKAIANLNAYLSHYGLDAIPVDRDNTWSAAANEAPEKNDMPLAPADSESWLKAITAWSDRSVIPENRAKIADQLVDVIDHQVQACYQHMNREIVMNATGQTLSVNESPTDTEPKVEIHTLTDSGGPYGP